MARISTYPLDTELVGSDYWIGSDANSNYATKNFTIDSVAEYMNRVATQTQALRFKYTNTIPINSGTLTFDPPGAGAINFSTITTFILSKNELTNLSTDISSFYTAPLAGSDVLFTTHPTLVSVIPPAVYPLPAATSPITGRGIKYLSSNKSSIPRDSFGIFLIYPFFSIACKCC